MYCNKSRSLIPCECLTPLHSDFVRLVVQRYQAPKISVVRQRLKIARAAQAGYLKLHAYLCPDVDQREADPRKNKLLQAIDIYIESYCFTVECYAKVEMPFRHSLKKTNGSAIQTMNDYYTTLRQLEYKYLEKTVPIIAQRECFVSIMPSFDKNAAEAVASSLDYS